MRFFLHFAIKYCQYIDNSCQYRLLSENNSPPPSRLFPFRDLTLGSCDSFLSFVVILIMPALKGLHEVTACIYKGEEKPVMKWSFLTKVENKDLRSFLQALSAFGVD